MKNRPWAAFVALACAGLTGCGKIPTWGELTGGQQPAAPATPTAPATPVAPVQQVVAPPPVSPAEVVGKFQALRPAEINDGEFLKLTALNQGLEQVTTIDAAGSQITANGLQQLEKLTGLQQLKLNNTRVDDAACAKIALVPSLEILTLSDTPVTSVGIAAISSLPNLKVLELKHCFLDENGFVAISKLPALKTVVLDSTNMDNRKLDLLCDSKSITELTLPRNAFDDYGLIALKKLDGLEYLELGETRCTGAGLSAATKAGGLKNLKFLGMYACPINELGAKAISTIKSLERISLGKIDHMGDADFAFIVKGMKHLKYVYIAQCNNLDGSGLQQLQKGSKDLEELYIHQCSHIGDPAVKILKNFKNLKILSLHGTAITPNGVAELKNALPDCKIE